MSSELDVTRLSTDTATTNDEDTGIDGEKSLLDGPKDEISQQHEIKRKSNDIKHNEAVNPDPPAVTPPLMTSPEMSTSADKRVTACKRQMAASIDISSKQRRLTNNNPSVSSLSMKGGLASLVGSLTKKEKKQSMLSKSAQDWRQFVHEEKLEEDLSTHLKSRDSFLDKQDFLLRADYKQFEHERDLRAQERKTKQPQSNAPD